MSFMVTDQIGKFQVLHSGLIRAYTEENSEERFLILLKT